MIFFKSIIVTLQRIEQFLGGRRKPAGPLINILGGLFIVGMGSKIPGLMVTKPHVHVLDQPFFTRQPVNILTVKMIVIFRPLIFFPNAV